MQTDREVGRWSGTWLTCFECGDWYGPESEAKKRPYAGALAGVDPKAKPQLLTRPACPKCGGFLK